MSGMRQILRAGALLLVLCLTGGLFAACGSEGEKETDAMESSQKTETESVTPETGPVETGEAGPEIRYSGYDTPCLVDTVYTKEAILADAVVTNGGKLNADPTGQTDAASAFNAAIRQAYEKGGGTVFVPAGTYLLRGHVEVLPFVSLVGDYDPDGTGTTGTVILARPENLTEPLFSIGGSAGVVGLSVYYPDQSLQDVKTYAPTFCIPGSAASGPAYYMLSTVANCTVFNGYDGVYAGSVNEQMNIHDVKGTFLHSALELYDSADASTIRGVTASASFWATCALGSENAREIRNHTRRNGQAFVFGDVEWGSFMDLRCEGYETGMHIVSGPRAKFSGIVCRCELLDCACGLVVDDIDTRGGYGMSVTFGRIEGGEYAVLNNTAGRVQLMSVELDGDVLKGEGAGCLQPEVYEGSVTESPSMTLPSVPDVSRNLSVVKADKTAGTDVTAKIQAALDALSGTGGICYLPAGYYRIDGRLTIPDGVELRGAGFVPVRDQMELSLGTILFSMADTEQDPENPIVRMGARSGFRNLILVNTSHDRLGDYLENGRTFEPSSYLIRAEGKQACILNSALCGAVNGIALKDADGSVVSNLSLLCYSRGIDVTDTRGVYVETVLTNVTVGFRNRWWGLSNYRKLFPNGWEENFEASIGRDPDGYATVQMMMDNLSQVRMENVTGAVVRNVFSYGAKHTLDLSDSEVLAFNLGKDCYWRYVVETPMLLIRGSSLQLFNQHRFNGTSYEASGGSEVLIYGRVTIGQKDLPVDPE